MYEFMNTIEIALFIILPLIIYFQRSKLKMRVYILNVIFLYLIWFFTYALLHELMHLLGAWISNGNVIHYQLMPKFWKGDTSTGFVETIYSSHIQEFFIVLLPYARDVIFTLIGCLIMRKTIIRNYFFRGLILIILVLSPAFDVVNNFVPYLFGALDDFNALKITSNSLVANSIGSLFVLITVGGILWVIIFTKPYLSETVKKSL
jgi:hypothetical protein